MNSSTAATPSDLLLTLDVEPQSLALVRDVTEHLGCDFVEAQTAQALADILAVRHPTLAILPVDRRGTPGLEVIEQLAQVAPAPATLLVGTADPRVTGSVRRALEARGIPVIGSRPRPLDADDIERWLVPHLRAQARVEAEDLRRALAEYELVLEYQPKIALAGERRVLGTEALVRWRHPRRGLLAPRQFLPAVEEYGLQVPLTDFVLTEAIRQLGQWRARGLALEMIVNLSPRLVHDRGFAERFTALLREQDVPPEWITFDVTETTDVARRELLLEVFTALRLQGVGLALDNFGTGMSSLTEIYRIPFTELKVDHALIVDAVREPDALQTVRAIVQLAHTLGMTACAEGVESSAMFELVVDAGFDAAQGRFLAKPQPAADLEQWIARGSALPASTTGLWRTAAVGAADDTSVTRRLRRLPNMSRANG